MSIMRKTCDGKSRLYITRETVRRQQSPSQTTKGTVIGPLFPFTKGIPTKNN